MYLSAFPAAVPQQLAAMLLEMNQFEIEEQKHKVHVKNNGGLLCFTNALTGRVIMHHSVATLAAKIYAFKSGSISRKAFCHWMLGHA